MPSYYIVSLVLYIKLLHTFVLLFTFHLCIVTHVHTTHATIYKLYVVENKKFSADSMCTCEVKWPAHAKTVCCVIQTTSVLYDRVTFAIHATSLSKQ